MTFRATLLALSLLVVSTANADDPKFEFAKPADPPAAKKVVWKAQANLGLILNTGNSNNVSFSAGAMGQRDDGWNRLTLEVGGAYARSTILNANDANANGLTDPGEVQRLEKTTTALWNVKLRYDRFLTTNNLLYITAFAMGNEPAGKKVAAGGQAGYGRQLYKSTRHLLNAELGIDYTFERSTSAVSDLHIASLRGYFGYTLSISKEVSLLADIEYLGNLNPEDGPEGNVKSFVDSRVNGRVALTARIWKLISLRASFVARFDNVPQPAPSLSLPYAAGYLPIAEKLDTISELALIVSFL